MINWTYTKDSNPEKDSKFYDNRVIQYVVQLENGEYLDHAIFIDGEWYLNFGAKLLIGVVKWLGKYKTESSSMLPVNDKDRLYLVTREEYGRVIAKYYDDKWIEDDKAELTNKILGWVGLD